MGRVLSSGHRLGDLLAELLLQDQSSSSCGVLVWFVLDALWLDAQDDSQLVIPRTPLLIRPGFEWCWKCSLDWWVGEWRSGSNEEKHRPDAGCVITRWSFRQCSPVRRSDSSTTMESISSHGIGSELMSSQASDVS